MFEVLPKETSLLALFLMMYDCDIQTYMTEGCNIRDLTLFIVETIIRNYLIEVQWKLVALSIDTQNFQIYCAFDRF